MIHIYTSKNYLRNYVELENRLKALEQNLIHNKIEN